MKKRAAINLAKLPENRPKQAGDMVDVYFDYQTQEKFAGKAILLEKLYDSYDNNLCFIIEDNSSYSVINYAYEKWKLLFAESPYYKPNYTRVMNIRYIAYIGREPVISRERRKKDIEQEETLSERYIVLHGIELF